MGKTPTQARMTLCEITTRPGPKHKYKTQTENWNWNPNPNRELKLRANLKRSRSHSRSLSLPTIAVHGHQQNVEHFFPPVPRQIEKHRVSENLSLQLSRIPRSSLSFHRERAHECAKLFPTAKATHNWNHLEQAVFPHGRGEKGDKLVRETHRKVRVICATHKRTQLCPNMCRIAVFSQSGEAPPSLCNLQH